MSDPADLISQALESIEAGRYDEGEGLLRRFARDVPADARDDGTMVRFHIGWANVLCQGNEYTDAAQHCIEALHIAEGSGDIGAQARIFDLLGRIHERKGDYHMALEYLDAGLVKARKVRDKTTEGAIHVDKGNALTVLGQLDAAAGEFREAILLLEHMNVPMELARAYNNLGDTLMRRGQWTEAAELFEKAKSVAKDRILKGWGGFNKAECLVELQRYDEARRELQESIGHLEAVGDNYGLVGAYQILGLVEARTGNFENAASAFDRSLEISGPLEMPVSEAKVIRDMGRMFMWKGEKEMARVNFKKAMAIFKEHGAAADVAMVEKDLVELDRS